MRYSLFAVTTRSVLISITILLVTTSGVRASIAEDSSGNLHSSEPSAYSNWADRRMALGLSLVPTGVVSAGSILTMAAPVMADINWSEGGRKIFIGGLAAFSLGCVFTPSLGAFYAGANKRAGKMMVARLFMSMTTFSSWFLWEVTLNPGILVFFYTNMTATLCVALAEAFAAGKVTDRANAARRSPASKRLFFSPMLASGGSQGSIFGVNVGGAF